MKLYNTYSQKKEELRPLEEGKVSMYVCGPTVYNYPHIGNARPIVVFDTLKKALEAQGLDVTFASNYTDVDDKIIHAAKEAGITEKELTDHYIKAYQDVRASLHADEPDAAPRVTQTMDAIIAFIEKMIENGSAYQAGNDVYFRVAADKNYGELSHQKIEDLQVGARIEENQIKENPLDFTLWKKTEEGIQWDSPWGKGRPGWHTECVVMIQDVFKKHLIDLHGGGMDLQFPHHENEVAQSRCVNNTPLANMWVHNGMINIDGIKMSKSLGNVRWAKDLIDEFGGDVVRWVMISAYYRAPLNLSEEAFATAGKELEKIRKAASQANVQLQLAGQNYNKEADSALFSEFIAACNDDLNTPNAIAAVQKTVKVLNQSLRVREKDYDRISSLLETLKIQMHVLGADLELPVLSEEDKALHAEWKNAAAEKDFEKADRLRKTLQEKGIL